VAIRISSLVLGFALCAQLAFAQVNTATISGTVHDVSGAVLPGVSVGSKIKIREFRERYRLAKQAGTPPRHWAWATIR